MQVHHLHIPPPRLRVGSERGITGHALLERIGQRRIGHCGAEICVKAEILAQAQQAGIVTITGTSGNDDINAGAFTSNLTFFPGMGSDTLVSGSGDDTFNFSGDGAWDDSDIVTAGTGLDTINSTGSIHIDSANATGIDVMNFFSNGLGDAIYIPSSTYDNADNLAHRFVEKTTNVLDAETAQRRLGVLGDDPDSDLLLLHAAGVPPPGAGRTCQV